MRWCKACQRARFPRTDPAVIVAILDDADRLLLGHHAGWEPTRVSILAGFVEAGESLEMAVHREIRNSGRIRAVYDFLAQAVPQALTAPTEVIRP